MPSTPTLASYGGNCSPRACSSSCRGVHQKRGTIRRLRGCDTQRHHGSHSSCIASTCCGCIARLSRMAPPRPGTAGRTAGTAAAGPAGARAGSAPRPRSVQAHRIVVSNTCNLYIELGHAAVPPGEQSGCLCCLSALNKHRRFAILLASTAHPVDLQLHECVLQYPPVLLNVVRCPRIKVHTPHVDHILHRVHAVQQLAGHRTIVGLRGSRARRSFGVHVEKPCACPDLSSC